MRTLENKIPPPLIAFLAALLMWALSLLPPHFEIALPVRIFVSICFVLLGACFCLPAFALFWRAKTTVNPHQPQDASKLVTSGIYRISRNPMYAGLVLFLLAWGAYLASPWALAGLIGFILYMNRFQIEPEERALSKLFGAEYEDYKSKVRRWL